MNDSRVSAPVALIVDDNPVIREVLRLRMERLGWLVTEAADASSGLRAFRSCKPRLVTLDLIMPINDGVGAVELAKAITDESPRTTLVVLSGFAGDQEVSNFFRKHRIALLSKNGRAMDELFAFLDRD